MLIPYCTGLIIVCTALLLVATVVTVKNYWLLRELTQNDTPGRHDRVDVVEPRGAATTAAAPRQTVTYYDSSTREDASATGEWTGPVIPYTPAYRGGQGPE